MTEFFTARERVRLQRILEHWRCVWCYAPIDYDNYSDECSECGNPGLTEDDLIGVRCPFCEYMNPLPKPLDAELQCQECGADL